MWEKLHCRVICAAIRDARAVSGAQPIQFSPYCAARPTVSPNYPSNPPPHPRRSRASFGHDIGIRTSARSHNWAIFAVLALVFTHNRPLRPTPSRMCANSEAIASQPEKADKFRRQCRFRRHSEWHSQDLGSLYTKISVANFSLLYNFGGCNGRKIVKRK